MTATDRKIRIGIYGCGSWANRTHIPNLLKLDGVEIVAICDSNPESLKSTGEAFNISRTYADGDSYSLAHGHAPAYRHPDT